ncbi:hypothetical protein [Streptomyces roseicoloratus]|uniref:hypothetical protein n=1 Tax=Streptomyces roseicoloratus TaxID=2508722 RepID=UPI001009A3F6|nr:hypothetical protein [Streptomyces roseicoloratus]
MSTTPKPVRGPMHIEATALHITADVTPLVENNVHDLLDLLMEEDLFEAFMELACTEPTGEHDGHAPDRLAFEELKDRLVERLATKVALTGRQALGIADQMRRLGAARSVPGQQDRRWSA